MKRALITGINGQDGSYLAELLLAKGYEVTHSVKDFLRTAFAVADLDYERHVVVGPELFRPSEAVLLCGDASRARRESAS